MSFPDRAFLPLVGVFLLLLVHAGCSASDTTVIPNTSNPASTEPQSKTACLQGCTLQVMACSSSKTSTERAILALRPSALGCEVDVARDGDAKEKKETFEVDCTSNRVCFGYDGATRECVPATISPTSFAYEMSEDGESIACGR